MTHGIGATSGSSLAADMTRSQPAQNAPATEDIYKSTPSVDKSGAGVKAEAEFSRILETHLQEAERMQAAAQQNIEQISQAPRAPVGNVIAASRQATQAYDMLASARDEMMQAYARLSEHKR